MRRFTVAGLLAVISLGAPCAASAVAAPTVITGPATQITQTTARMNGTVNPNGTPVRYHFVFYEGGFPIDRLSHDAGAGTAPVAVSSLLSGLIPGTTYSFELVAVDADSNTFTGNRVTFTTKKGNCVVPRLRGLLLFAAEQKLSVAHCRTGKIRYRNLRGGFQRFLDRLTARVVSQSPRAGRRVPADSKVSLVLSPRR